MAAVEAAAERDKQILDALVNRLVQEDVRRISSAPSWAKQTSDARLVSATQTARHIACSRSRSSCGSRPTSLSMAGWSGCAHGRRSA